MSDPEVNRDIQDMQSPDDLNWRYLIPVASDATILSVGSELRASALQGLGRDVYILQPPARAGDDAFLSKLDRDQSAAIYVAGSPPRLPFKPASFDIAVLYGIASWEIPDGAGCVKDEGRVGGSQNKALQAVAGALRNGGYFCLGIQNRWDYRNFLGARDPVTGLPFVAVLPRRVANWYCRLRTGRPYRAHLHSAAGYRRLLERAGFSDIGVYCSIPSYRKPKFIVPLREDAFGYYRGHFDSRPLSSIKDAVVRILGKLGWDKFLVSSFLIVARIDRGGLT